MLLNKIESRGMGMENPTLERVAPAPVPAWRSCVSCVGVDQQDAQCQAQEAPVTARASASSLAAPHPYRTSPLSLHLRWLMANILPLHPAPFSPVLLPGLSLHRRLRNSLLEGLA